MPLYRMTVTNRYNDGLARLYFEVEAPSPEVAENLAKRQLSSLFRDFPAGHLSTQRQYSQANVFAQTGALEGGFEHQGDSVIDPVAASQLLGEWGSVHDHAEPLISPHITNFQNLLHPEAEAV